MENNNAQKPDTGYYSGEDATNIRLQEIKDIIGEGVSEIKTLSPERGESAPRTHGIIYQATTAASLRTRRNN